MKRWVKNWIILKRACVFDWLNIEKYTVNQIYKNINYLTYSFLFIGDLNFKYQLATNLFNIHNKLILDSFFFNKQMYISNIIHIFNQNVQVYKNNFIYLIFIYYFYKDLNMQIFFNFYLFNNKDNDQKNMYILKNLQKKLIYFDYYKLHKMSFIPKYSKSIYIYTYIYWFIYFLEKIYKKKKNCGLFYKKKFFIIYGYLNW